MTIPESLAHFVDGSRWPGSGTGELPVRNPATGRQISTVRCGGADDVDHAVSVARAAFENWGRTTPKERSDVLLDCAAVIAAHREELAALESADTGKPTESARGEIDGAVDAFRFMAGAARSMQSPSPGEYLTGRTSMIVREPLGVIAAITPWNFPLLTAAQKIAPILAAGNTCVLKPSEHTPLTAHRLAELLSACIPAGVLNVVNGDGAVVGQALAAHADIALVSVTGSVRSGQAVARVASETLKRVHLELGGKAPALVLADADLQAAAEGIAAAGFGNTGQDCGAACRVLVAESVADEFTAFLVEQAHLLSVGDPSDGENITMGPLITEPQYERVLGFLDRARADGVRAVTGGHKLDRAGFFIEPTILVDVPADAECVRDEIFGPVITVQSFPDESSMVAAANNTDYGLAASVWTEDARAALELPRLLNFGTVWVNTHLEMPSEVPWGGYKHSGYGRDMSLFALEDYARTKHVMLNSARSSAH
ncbi:aldehyde dehydrogenase family protein [Mycolicibacterium neoaurum]|uniref:aldehyde dehydrogenase family protein n=1 Tax=Mycolicibacterium neoaurum TaxID=1795 RepID=UPI002673EB7B|nr:aldehyde dehydrogenase family protein [Mycolicibacterium neoaurum]MDO3399567.1 aldehyde dehydrogenase family protein [Mycolicibacterium neoaurum]